MRCRVSLRKTLKASMQHQQYFQFILWLHTSLNNNLKVSMRLHASLDYILKGIHATPVIFKVHIVALCISRLYLKGLHAASCGSCGI